MHADATVEQSVRPTMVTVPDAQLWAMSTAGTFRSVWWREKLEAGRAAAQMGVDSGMCLLEWAADPGADPTSEATWWGCMPALGRLADVDVVRQDLASMGVDQFKRAYLNLWPHESDSGWRVLPRELWTELQV